MDLRQQVLDLCNPSDLVVLDWITKQLDDFPIEVDQTPESYITARARSINVTVDDPSESEPSQSPASIHQPELEPELDTEGMAIQTKPNGGGAGEGGAEGAPIDGGVISSDDDENEVIIVDDQEEDEDEEDPIAGYDEDNVVLLRPERISQDDELMESATTSRTNSSSPQPNPDPNAASPPPPPPPSAAPSSSSASSSLPAPPSTTQPTTISPSLLQAPVSTPAPPAQAPLPRIQTLASSSSHSKSKSPSPAPDEAGSPSSTTPTSTQPPTTLAQSDYRPYLSDALITKSPVSTANKLISLLSSSPSLFIPASDRSEILHAMNKSGNSRYYAAWVANPDGMDVLAGWLKGLTGKESEPWRATAVVLLEVIKKMEVTKEMLVDKKKKFVLGRLANKVAGNAALTEKVRSLAQSIVDTYSKILGIAPAVSTSSGGGGNDEGSNKKRKVDSTTNGSSSSSTKPTTSSTLKPSSTSSSTKPPAKPLAKVKPSGPAAKTDTSWFAKPVVHAAPVKKPSTTTTSAASSSSAPKPTTTSSSSAPATSSSSSSSSNVFQQALTLTGSSSSTLGKRPISAVDGSNLSGGLGGKRKKTITWRDDVRPERGLEDVRVFEKAGWEIQFEGTHDQTLAQLDKDEGRSMKGHVLEDPMELKDIEDEMGEWYEPRALLITPDMLQNIYPYTGLHASERLAINQGTLETIYLSPSDIPESPAEPDPSRIVEDGPATRYYEAVVVDPAPAFQQPLYPPLPPPASASAPLGLANLDLGLILSQLNSSGSIPIASSVSNAYAPPPLPSSSSYYPGIPPPPSQNNEYNPSYAPGPPPPSSYNNQYNQPGPSSYTREGGGGGGPLPPQQQMHESSFGKRKGPGGEGNGRGGKKGRQQQHDGGGGGGGGGNERPWGSSNNDGGGGGAFNARDQLERERNKRGPCKFFNSGRCAKGSTCEFRH